MMIGKVYPPEWKTFTDSQTGRRVTQLTDSSAHDYHLYFYNPSITRDNKYLIFISERNRHQQSLSTRFAKRRNCSTPRTLRLPGQIIIHLRTNRFTA